MIDAKKAFGYSVAKQKKLVTFNSFYAKFYKDIVDAQLNFFSAGFHSLFSY